MHQSHQSMSANHLMASSRLPPSNGIQNIHRTSNSRSSNSAHSSPSITLERVMKDHHSSNSPQSVKHSQIHYQLIIEIMYGLI